MWRKIYSEMAKKGKKKSSTGLYDRDIVRKRVQNKSHYHVHEYRTFSKGRTWCKLTITPISGTLAKSRNHLIFGHSPQTLITGVVKMLYPQDTEHIRYQLWCDNYTHTSNASVKERYWRIKFMHVGVKLLDQHGSTSDQEVTQWLPTSTMNDSG